MNDFAVIANEPLDIDGRRYETGEALTLQADACAPLLVLGRVRLSSTPLVERPKPRARRRYQRRDLQAEP